LRLDDTRNWNFVGEGNFKLSCREAEK